MQKRILLKQYKYSMTVLGLFLVIGALYFATDSSKSQSSAYFMTNNDKSYLCYLPFRDTVYYLGKNYIMISLKEQKARLISRNDSAMTFRISSGNQNIKEGQSTPEGFFTVQNKSPMAISKQFNNAELFNWIGFNGNVGFHGLQGSGYYATLGFRPSSHGCVRISREDGQKLYQKVSVGTPVIVYYNEPLRVIKFAKLSEFNPEKDVFMDGTTWSVSRMMNRRMESVYKGRAYRDCDFRVFLSGSFIMRHSTITNGDTTRLPKSQLMPISFNQYKGRQTDNTEVGSYFIKADTCKIDFR